MSSVAPTKHSSESSLRREKSVSLSHAYLGKGSQAPKAVPASVPWGPLLPASLEHRCGP